MYFFDIKMFMSYPLAVNIFIIIMLMCIMECTSRAIAVYNSMITETWYHRKSNCCCNVSSFSFAKMFVLLENFTIKSFLFILGVLCYKILTNRRHTHPHQKKIHVIKTQIKQLNHYNPPPYKGCILLRSWKMQNAEVRALESSKAVRKRCGIIICRDRVAYNAIDGAYFKHAQRTGHG